MKRIFLFFLVFILITNVSAQDSTLRVLFQSIEEEAVVDLNNYLKGDQFFVNHSKNLDVQIKNGIATIKSKKGWTGAELLIFSTNETVSTQPIIFIKPSKEIQKVDLSEIIMDFYINKSFLNFKDAYENLTEVNLTLYNKTSEILINKDTLITIDFDSPFPLFSIELNLKKETQETQGFSFNPLPYIIGFALFVLLLSILFTFKDMLLNLVKPKREYLSKAKAKSKALRHLDNISLRGNPAKKIVRILNTFFREAYNIKSRDSYLKTTSALRKRKIPFSLKEDLINYYERAIEFYNKELILKDKDLSNFMENLKDLIRRT